MLDEIREAVRRVPFQPFWIELTRGTDLPVPHPDHILVGLQRVVVEDDRGVMNVLAPPNITRIRAQERETSA